MVLFSPALVGRDFKEARLRDPVMCLPQPQRHSGLGCDSLIRSLKGFERLPVWIWQLRRGQHNGPRVENGTEGAEAFSTDHEASSPLLPG